MARMRYPSNAFCLQTADQVGNNLLIPTTRVQASRLIVMLLGGCQRRMTQDIHDAAGILRVIYRDGRRGAIAEKMRPQVLSKCGPRVLLNPVRDRIGIQGGGNLRNPENIARRRALATAAAE